MYQSQHRGENEWWCTNYESFSEDHAEHFPTVEVMEGVFANYLKWSPFISLQLGTGYGLYHEMIRGNSPYGTGTAIPAPVPTTLLLFTAGLAGITGYSAGKRQAKARSPR